MLLAPSYNKPHASNNCIPVKQVWLCHVHTLHSIIFGKGSDFTRLGKNYNSLVSITLF